jgi:hypothetical protein
MFDGSLPPDEQRCVASTTSPSSPDGRCKRFRIKGGTQCWQHANNRTRSAAQRRHAEYMAKDRAMKRLEREGYPVINGPEAVIEILEERLSVQVALSRMLDTAVRRLAESDELRYEHRAGEQLRGELQAWLKLNEQVARLGMDYVKIGLDERKVRIAEAQAAILIGVIDAVMKRLELTSEQKKIAAVVIPEEFERVAIEGQ